MFKERRRADAAGRTRAATPALLDALARPNDADLDEFRRGIDPLASSGRLGALLAQFPASFKDTPASRDYLAGLLRAFAGYPRRGRAAPQELERRIGETLALLNTFGAAWVQIDEPKFRFSIRQNYLPNVKGFYYMRLHGRNAEQWWRHDKSEDRYDYLYSAGELKEFSETADAAQAARQEALSLHEQPLLGEVGRERRDDQAAARRADRRRRTRRSSSRAIRSSLAPSAPPRRRHCFTYGRRIDVCPLAAMSSPAGARHADLRAVSRITQHRSAGKSDGRRSAPR